MTVLYPILCLNEVCYKGTVLYVFSNFRHIPCMTEKLDTVRVVVLLWAFFLCRYSSPKKRSTYIEGLGAQWLSGRGLDSRPRGRGFEPHRRHCVVVLGQDTFILA